MLRVLVPGAGTVAAWPVVPVGLRNRTTPCPSMKYTRLLVVLIGRGTSAAALGHATWVGLLAWVLAATIPFTPIRLMAYVGPMGRVTSTPKLPVTGGGGGDTTGVALGEASGELEGDGSEDAVAEGLA
jgi:hypothetical protein